MRISMTGNHNFALLFFILFIGVLVLGMVSVDKVKDRKNEKNSKRYRNYIFENAKQISSENTRKIRALISKLFGECANNKYRIYGVVGSAMFLIPLLNPNEGIHVAIIKNGQGYFSSVILSKFIGIPYGLWMTAGILLILAFLHNFISSKNKR